MHPVKTDLFGNWKENNFFFFCGRAMREGQISLKKIQSINDSLFPRSAALEKTSNSEVTSMSLTNRILEDLQVSDDSSSWLIGCRPEVEDFETFFCDSMSPRLGDPLNFNISDQSITY